MEKVDLVLSQDETINEIKFSDLFNLEDIQRIQDLFAESTGVAFIITQPDGTPITRPSNFCRLCKDIIRKTEPGLQHCLQSDSIIGKPDSSGPNVKLCLSGGLWEAGISISIGGQHIANWVIGQVKNGGVNEEEMLKYADEIGADRKDFISALAEVPIMLKEKFEKVAVMLHAIANELSTKAIEHYQLEQYVLKQKQSELALKESEYHYRQLVEFSPNTVAIHLDGKIVYINPAGIKLLEVESDQEILGKSAIEFVHPDDRDKVMKRIGKSIMDGIFAPMSEERFLLPNGRIKQVEVTGIPIIYQGKQAMEVLINDISDRKASEKALQSSDAMLSAFMEYIPSLILIKDHELRPVFANKKFHDHFPMSLWMGKKPHELFPPDIAGEMVEKDTEALNTGYTSYEETWRDMEGVSRIFFTEKFRIDLPDSPPLLGSIITDITEKKRSELTTLENEEIFSQFLQRSPIHVFFKDEQARSMRLSQNFEEMLGRPMNELLGKTMADLFPSEFAKKMVEDDIRVLEEGKEVIVDEEFNGRSYTTVKFPINISGKPRFLAGFTIDVTQKKQAEETLLESEKRYRLLAESLRISEQRVRALIENAPDGIVMVNKEDKFIYASPPACRMFGYEMDDIEKQLPSELTHPEDLPMVYETLGKLIQNPALIPTIQYRFRHKNGHWSWIESTFSNLLDTPGIEAIVINFRDITDRKNAEDKIRENDLRFRKLSTGLEQSPGAVVITDTKGLIEYVNPKFTYFSGYTLDMVQGKVARILKPGRTTDEIHDQIWRSVISGKEWTGEYLSKKRNGETYWESVTVAPILDPGGKMTNIIITMEDISERKRMISELVDARKKAEQSDRLKSAFLANMSHEIRTPMNAIVGFAEMLSDTDLTPEDRTQFSSIIQSRSDDLMHIINDLLEISRIESGNFTVVKTEFMINKVLDDLEMVFRKRLHQINKAHLSFEVEKALTDHQSAIYTDGYIFKQVFSNLIENAIKCTHTGSIRFGYNQPDNGFITFYVKDTGIGISTENQNVIFEHFRQAEIENPHRYSGTGLGLAICRGSLTHLNGRIWVVSEPGKGSTFYFTIPVDNPGFKHERNNLQTSSGIQKSVPNTDRLWAGKQMLIVEDEPTNMEFLKIILKRSKVEITSAESGALLRKLYNNLDQFDLVLLDVRLPDANGWELAREIKAIRPELPIIAQTAYAMSEDLQKSRAAGCDNYISKPINKEKLLILIAQYLGKN